MVPHDVKPEKETQRGNYNYLMFYAISENKAMEEKRTCMEEGKKFCTHMVCF